MKNIKKKKEVWHLGYDPAPTWHVHASACRHINPKQELHTAQNYHMNCFEKYLVKLV